MIPLLLLAALVWISLLLLVVSLCVSAQHGDLNQLRADEAAHRRPEPSAGASPPGIGDYAQQRPEEIERAVA
jgi:hypothetical protein